MKPLTLGLNESTEAESNLAAKQNDLAALGELEAADAREAMRLEAEKREAEQRIADCRNRRINEFLNDEEDAELRRIGRDQQEKVKQIDTTLAAIGKRRSERAPELERLRNAAKAAVFAVDVAQGKGAIEQLDSDLQRLIDTCASVKLIIERCQAKYPAHQWLPGNITLKAHAGMPPLLGFLRTISDAARLLQDKIGEWDRSVLAPNNPSRTRAERIEAAEEHRAAVTNAAQRQQVQDLRKVEAARAASAAHPAPPPKPRDAVDLLREADDAIRAARR